tara:strand:+ start:578 stop:772 length:195 start_codon:yes stop_codon:yes gene_type:complete
METFVILFWLVGSEVAIPLHDGVGCHEYYDYLEEIERITHDIPNTYLDGVEVIGYTCKLLKTQE